MGILQASLGGVASGAQAATFLAAVRRSAAGAVAFPAMVSDADYGFAYFGPKSGGINSGGSSWTPITSSAYAGRRLTAADIASGYSVNDETLIVFYRGPVGAALKLASDSGVGGVASLGSFTRSDKHAGIVVPMYGAATGSEQIGSPVSPTPFVSRVSGGYNVTVNSFVLQIYDRLTPPYVSGTDITWQPAASDGNGIAIIELLNQ